MWKVFVSVALSLGIALAAPPASQAMTANPPSPVAAHVILADYDIYEAPREGGAPLDWCVSYAHDCGSPAAERFCRQMGFPHAAKFDSYHPGQTYIPLGDNHYCNGPQCTALRNVECSF